MLTLYTIKSCPMRDYATSTLARKQIPFILSVDKEVMSIKDVTHFPALETEEGNLLSRKALVQYVSALQPDTRLHES